MAGKEVVFLALVVLSWWIDAGACSAQETSARPLRQEAGRKRLIAFPRPEPDTAFMRKHAAVMETMPFDGTFFGINYTKPDGKQGKFQWDNFQQGYPDLTVFLSLGYSGAWYSAQGGKPLKDCDYGLLAPFMDGMTEAVKGRTKIVDGYEIGSYLQPATLHFGYKAMDKDLLGIVADPKKYASSPPWESACGWTGTMPTGTSRM